MITKIKNTIENISTIWVILVSLIGLVAAGVTEHFNNVQDRSNNAAFQTEVRGDFKDLEENEKEKEKQNEENALIEFQLVSGGIEKAKKKANKAQDKANDNAERISKIEGILQTIEK